MAVFTILDSILAGIAGTLAMTLFIRFTGMVAGYQLSVPRILGTLFSSSPRPSGSVSQRLPVLILGTTIHCLIGIFFTLLYAWLVGMELLPKGYINGLLYGSNLGMVAVIVWYIALRLHPMPPALPLRLFLAAIFTGHLVFAASIVTTFNLLLTIF
ncbi:hypothetical protein LL912_05185 [Niabella sp. CC-SYL272]|uniref:hypothetical protein n=1 Tax=Niabella agricola TaxID=2891571 RepID=UPI001F430089|nr:hypothetical protein [Niabella agricola]MCF3108163.1 hypothetical protein [Niabella agricola]